MYIFSELLQNNICEIARDVLDIEDFETAIKEFRATNFYDIMQALNLIGIERHIYNEIDKVIDEYCDPSQCVVTLKQDELDKVLDSVECNYLDSGFNDRLLDEFLEGLREDLEKITRGDDNEKI
jgi:hypothetical protein